MNWPTEGLPSGSISWRAQQLVIGDNRPESEWTFYLTNLLLQNFSDGSGAATITLYQGCVNVVLCPMQDYLIRAQYLRAYNSVDVTATLRISGNHPEHALKETASDLCLILTALTGHKVNWIARESASVLVFEDRVTKPCSGWPVLGRLDKALGQTWTWCDLLNAAASALPTFQRHATTYRLRTGLIDSWIDARIATDFLESRTLKTAAILEMIKTDHIYQPGVASNFRSRIEAVHNDLGLTLSANHLTEIVDIRNTIIHEGRFVQTSTLSGVRQYELLSEHTDRLVLALVGHASP